jgi:hypothetical protein
MEINLEIKIKSPAHDTLNFNKPKNILKQLLNKPAC